MCGIIGKAGMDNVFPELLNGLKNLEYRGYDSVGTAVIINNEIVRCRVEGRVDALEKALKEKPKGSVGIGHTRWATHGAPTVENAHPHMDDTGRFALVHNGIIENAEELRHTFLRTAELHSQTDTEVAVRLLGKLYKGDVIDALSELCRLLRGSYAFGILCADFPDTVFACALASPLLVVKCEDGFCIASDLGAVTGEYSEVYGLSEGEMCALTSNTVIFYSPSGERIEKYPEDTVSEKTEISKSGYEHYMLKEIYEQPTAVNNTVNSFIKDGEIVFENINFGDGFFKNELKKLYMVACGSAYHTALSAKPVIEELCNLPCDVYIASEYRYSACFADTSTLGVFISQSGETADTLAALRLTKAKNARTLGIVNVQGSALAKESESVIYTKAGREIAVATTKAYSAQLTALYALAIYIGSIRGCISEKKRIQYISELRELPQKMEKTLHAVDSKMKELSAKIYNSKDIFYIGRLADYATACEGALKMKEITYINSQAYSAGELKHGTISLVNDGTPVIAVANSGRVYEKTLSNISEVAARGGRVFVITNETEKNEAAFCEDVIKVPETLSLFQSVVSVLPIQLLSYYTAKLLGRDIDRPRNLAKSVTVE